MEDKHFKLLFWFCVSLSGYGMIFLTCLVWIPIPEQNVRFADVILGFITGTLVSAAINYLLGGNPAKSTKEQRITTEVTPDSTTITTEPAKTEENGKV